MTNYLDDKYYFMHHLDMQPSEIEELPWYEYIHYRIKLGKYLEDKAKSLREQEKEANKQKSYKAPRYKRSSKN